MQKLSAEEARALEPELACVAAYLSPSTGVIDTAGLMTALEGHLTTLGGEVVLNAAVTRIEAPPDADGDFTLEIVSGGETSAVTASNVVIAAGFGGTQLGRTLAYPAGYSVPETYPAKGHYFALSGRAPFQRLVYPMPHGAWLGVHLTFDVAHRARFGPDIAWIDAVTYDFEDADGARRTAFERAIRRYWPGSPRRRLAARQRRRAPEDLPRGRARRRFPHRRAGGARHPAPRRALRHREPRPHVIARNR